jgi:Icc-related predicted phosphoesterase
VEGAVRATTLRNESPDGLTGVNSEANPWFLPFAIRPCDESLWQVGRRVIPAVGVIGNHDFESGKVLEVKSILKETGLTLLDGESVELLGVGFAGVCGFGGGFAPHMLNAWGEPIIKDFVQETINRALSLEKALARVESAKRVVLLHYSPTRETVEGESPEI